MILEKLNKLQGGNFDSLISVFPVPEKCFAYGRQTIIIGGWKSEWMNEWML